MSELARRLALVTEISSPLNSWRYQLRRLLSRPALLQHQIEDGMPGLLVLLSACIRGGAPFVDAITWIRDRSVAPMRDELDSMLSHFKVGATVAQSLLNFEQETKNPDLRELALKLALADQLGSPVAKSLDAMVDSSAAALDAGLSAVGAKKENQLLYPLVFLVLPVTVLFVVFPSIQFLQVETI